MPLLEIGASSAATLLARAAIAGTRAGSGRIADLRGMRAEKRVLTAIEVEISDIASVLADQLEALTPAVDKSEWIDPLLRSRDLRSVSALYINAKRADLADAACNSLTAAVRAVAALYCPPQVEPQAVASTIVASLDATVDRVVTSPKLSKSLALDTGSVVGHIIVNQLDGITRLVDLWNQHGEAEEQRYERMMRRHRRQVHKHHSHITPPDFSERRVVELDDIYVVPRTTGAFDDISALVTHLRDRGGGGIVVLGNPGAGKTTLTTYVAHQLSEDSPDGRDTAAVVVIKLRDFERKRAAHPMSIAEYASVSARDTLQVNTMADDWERIFTRGAAVVIFDGLDELLEVPRRVEMTEVIESFCCLYPHISIVVTCRYEGYSEAALSSALFETMRIEPFSESEIARYVELWFALPGNTISGMSTRESAARFLEESAVASELRDNPLLLSLMCILYRGHGYIPDNLSEIYRECTELLFERWDSHRQMRTLRFSDRLGALLERLAWWMYDGGLNEVGVTRRELEERCVMELEDLKSSDPLQQRAIATEFIDHCQGRAWVFADAGESDRAHRRFCFTHRSFMEYFAARRIARDVRRTGDVGEIVRLAFEVHGNLIAILTLQILGAEVDDVLETLIDHAEALPGAERAIAAEFFRDVLYYVDTHQRFAVRATMFALELTLDCRIPLWENPLQTARDMEFAESIAASADVVEGLAACREENRPAVMGALREVARESIPRRLVPSWNTYPMRVFREVEARGLLIGDPRVEEAERISTFQVMRDELAARVGNRRSYPEFAPGLVASRLLDHGGVARRWAAPLLDHELAPTGERCTSLLVRATLVDVSFNPYVPLACALLEECAASEAGLEFSSGETTRCLDLLEKAAYDPGCLLTVSLEDRLFAALDDSPALTIMLVCVHAMARERQDRMRDYAAASLLLQLVGETADDPYLRAADPTYDPIADARAIMHHAHKKGSIGAQRIEERIHLAGTVSQLVSVQ